MSMIKPYKKCKKCGTLIVSGKLCKDCKPMTNADRIRQMTDEELASEMARSICLKIEDCNLKDSKSCYYCRLRWLQKEVSKDAG